MANFQNNAQGDRKVSFQIRENISVLGTKDNGWTKEVNVVAWNGGADKIDLREWDPSHTRMSKGVTLFEAEAEKLAKVLADRYKIGAETPAPMQPIQASQPVQSPQAMQA